MAIPINGKSLTIDRLASIARGNEKVELSSEAVDRIRHCRNFVEERLAAGDVMYGLNTGIGEFSEVALDEDQVKDFQRFLIYNHAAGIGEPCPVEHVRAAMASRVNVHAKGHSGPRVEIPMMYVEMLNKGVTPVVCSKGSVGACGDLAPMSQIALVLMGEGECFYEGARMSTQKALERTGIKAPGLEARDGLAAINGSNLLTSISALTLHDAERWLKQAEIAAAMSLEALIANMKPYDQRLHEMRGFRGAVHRSCSRPWGRCGSSMRYARGAARVTLPRW